MFLFDKARKVKLLVCDDVALFKHVERVFDNRIAVDRVFVAVFCDSKRHFHATLALRRDGRHIESFRLFHDSVFKQIEFEFEAVESREHILVFNLYIFAFERKPNALIHFAHFVERRVGASVRSHDTVESESSVVGFVPPVSAVGVFYRAVCPHSLDCLIGKVPNISAAKSVVGAEVLPVVFEVAETVAHAVRVFALDERLVLVHLGSEKMSERCPQRH